MDSIGCHSISAAGSSVVRKYTREFRFGASKGKNEKKNSDSLLNHVKNSKSRNIHQKSGLCHVKSMDYNNKLLNTDLLGTQNNTIYDKTFNNNNKLNNMQINMSTQGNKLNWNYSYLKMKKIVLKKIIKLLCLITNDKNMISKNIIIKKYN